MAYSLRDADDSFRYDDPYGFTVVISVVSIA